jgi:ubiquinone/menaquinone biosynthesis C-methylase UbiE
MDIEKIKDRFDVVAKKYDEQRRFFIPCFDDYYQTSISFLSKLRPDFNSILDLGAGTGLLTKFLYEKFPNAKYTLVDASEQMIDIAKQRFKNLDNFSFVINDYSKELPSDQFDLVTSALSIHHLEDDAKAVLYSNISKKLPNNGCFINLDQFNAESDLLNEYYNQYWYDYIGRSFNSEKERDLLLQRRELDRENTISETIVLLKQIGFKHVECIYSYMKFGVIIAIK